MPASLPFRKLLAPLFLSAAISASHAQEQTWTPNFRDSDILEVIRAVQDATGKTMITDPRVRGQITVMSTTPVDTDTYYSIFLRALDITGFAAVEGPDGVVSIVPSQEVRAAPLPLAGTAQGPNGYVTEIIQLNNVAVNQVLPVIRPLVSQSNAQVSPYEAGNLLVIVDTAANIARIRQLLESIDAAATPATDVIRLQFADALEVVRLLEGMNATPPPVEGAAVASTGVQVAADRRTNSVLVTGDQRQRDRARELINRLDTPQEQDGNTRVIYLEYASAANVADVLERVVGNMAAQDGTEGETTAPATDATIEADEDTNSLIITADVETVNVLEAVIARLDIQRAQVLVEAIIVEINDDAGQNLGIQWLFRDESGGFASSFNSGNDAQDLANVTRGALAEDGREALTALGAGLAGSAGQTIGLGRITGSSDLLVLIDMLQATTGANILSTPNLLTTDNTPATITVGESVPFITGSFVNTGSAVQNPFQTVNRQNVGTTLKVTPHVNRGDKVALDISQEISSISPKAGAVDLITNERRIETRVTVTNGETVVLGGLIRDDVILRETRVPLLGSVPVMGRLFRSESSSVQKTNLLVFIRTTILRDDEALRGATAVKYQYIREQQINQQEITNLLMEVDELPLLPEWESILPPEPAPAEAVDPE